MARGIDIIIVDDDAVVCELVSEIVRRFYIWGEIFPFTDPDEAIAFCSSREMGVAIFVLDVFLGKETAFSFLDAIQAKFPMAHQDTIIITGNASDDIVKRCVGSDITHLLEKPIKPYALQLAIRTIVSKYVKFAKKLLQDPVLAESIARF